MIAALLILARTHLRRLGLRHPSTAEILQATAATKTRAYELAGRLGAMLGDLVGPPGRPPVVRQRVEDSTASLSQAVLRFLYSNPGAAGPRFYSEGFRKRLVELRESNPDVPLDAFADAVCVPRGTLEDWLRPGRASVASPARRSTEGDPAGSARIQSILAAWRSWRGPFTSFCDHVRHHLRIDYGRSLIARILHTYGERQPVRRPGRSPDERATKDDFAVYFAGAQWVGDGMQVVVEINGARFDFNLELDVDAYSAAIVGASIRDTEDAAAVIEAFEDGVATTGAAPLALLLDNRPSNHTDEVEAALADTMAIASTPGRGQSKAHVEGSFGLFSQAAPPLVVNASTPRDLAKELLRLRVQTWARTLNRRPRKDRDGKNRHDLYNDSAPTDAEIAEARQALEALRRKQEKSRATRLARIDPVVRELLDAAFDRLGLEDPKEHVRSAIARYTLDAVVDGIAIFEGKKAAGTLPANTGARYLLGIVRNVEHVRESTAITESLIRERLSLRDSMLAGLALQLDTVSKTSTEITSELRVLVDRAMGSERTIDRHFWLLAAGERLRDQPPDRQEVLFRAVARRIHANFCVRPSERAEADRIVARTLWPLC